MVDEKIEPDWCYKDDEKDDSSDEDYDGYIADEYHELKVLDLLD